MKPEESIRYTLSLLFCEGSVVELRALTRGYGWKQAKQLRFLQQQKILRRQGRSI